MSAAADYLKPYRVAQPIFIVAQRRFSPRVVSFLEMWVARWRSSQDGGDEQMFGAK